MAGTTRAEPASLWFVKRQRKVFRIFGLRSSPRRRAVRARVAASMRSLTRSCRERPARTSEQNTGVAADGGEAAGRRSTAATRFREMGGTARRREKSGRKAGGKSPRRAAEVFAQKDKKGKPTNRGTVQRSNGQTVKRKTVKRKTVKRKSLARRRGAAESGRNNREEGFQRGENGGTEARRRRSEIENRENRSRTLKRGENCGSTGRLAPPAARQDAAPPKAEAPPSGGAASSRARREGEREKKREARPQRWGEASPPSRGDAWSGAAARRGRLAPPAIFHGFHCVETFADFADFARAILPACSAAGWRTPGSGREEAARAPVDEDGGRPAGNAAGRGRSNGAGYSVSPKRRKSAGEEPVSMPSTATVAPLTVTVASVASRHSPETRSSVT